MTESTTLRFHLYQGAVQREEVVFQNFVARPAELTMPAMTGYVASLVNYYSSFPEVDLEEKQETDLALSLELSHLRLGGWVALDRLVGQYGEGETGGEAVEDLLTTLYEDRELLRREKSLVGPLERELSALERTLPEEKP